jgi:hypothetical protein
VVGQDAAGHRQPAVVGAHLRALLEVDVRPLLPLIQAPAPPWPAR